MTPTPETTDIAGLVEQKLRERAAFMREAGHNDDADLDNEAATALQSLSAELAEAKRSSDDWEAACDGNTALGAEMAEFWKARATTAEAEARAMREALEPFARLPEIPPRFSNADYVQMEIHYTISPEEMDNLQRLTGGAMRSDRASLLVSLDGVNAGDFRRARRAIGGSNAE